MSEEGEVKMDGDSDNFRLLVAQMGHINDKVANYAVLLTSLGVATSKVRGGRTGFTESEKEKM